MNKVINAVRTAKRSSAELVSTSRNESACAVATTAGLNVRSQIKAGSLSQNHALQVLAIRGNKAGLTVRSGLKSGSLSQNHNRQVAAAVKTTGLRVRSGLKSGSLSQNHNRQAVAAAKR